MSLPRLGIADAGRMLRAREISARELTDVCIQRIQRLDDQTNAIIGQTFEIAISQASTADEELGKGIDRGPLHGIPYGLKDIFDVAGVRTTCHSNLMKDRVASRDAALVATLNDAGAVLMGKLATHEFALGGPSFDLPFPPARNPWDTGRQPGGSSSGSAVAVAMGYMPVTFGTDTSGSIRGPAALTGVVGMRPTYGRVSRRGAFPLAFSLDCCGPLTWTVEDNAIALAVVARYDPQDPASVRVEDNGASMLAAVRAPIEGLKIGFVRNLFEGDDEVSPEVTSALQDVRRVLAGQGAHVECLDLPDIRLFDACCRVLMAAESYSIHKDLLRRHAPDYGNFTFQRIAVGAVVSTADYLDAQRLRLSLAAKVNALFDEHGFDALVCGNNAALAPLLQTPEVEVSPPTVVKTMPFAVSGHPALAVPCGLSTHSLPIGAQVVGPYFDEAVTYRVGAVIEAALGARDTRPQL